MNMCDSGSVRVWLWRVFEYTGMSSKYYLSFKVKWLHALLRLNTSPDWFQPDLEAFWPGFLLFVTVGDPFSDTGCGMSTLLYVVSKISWVIEGPTAVMCWAMRSNYRALEHNQAQMNFSPLTHFLLDALHWAILMNTGDCNAVDLLHWATEIDRILAPVSKCQQRIPWIITRERWYWSERLVCYRAGHVPAAVWVL